MRTEDLDFIELLLARADRIRAIIEGNEEDDILRGAERAEIFAGGQGRDRIIAGAGADQILVTGRESEFDAIRGGLGLDSIINTDETQNVVFDRFNALGSSIERIDGAGAGVVGNAEDNSLNFARAELVEVDRINGGSGGDLIVSSNITSAMSYVGGTGNDTLRGLSQDDILYGGEGDDSLNGASGDDSLFGGPGEDRIAGGSGNDFIDGGADNDTLFGGSGADRIEGADGDDSINGGSGNDEIFGGADNDSINASSGHDTVYGDDGNDVINTSNGNDTAFGGIGNDEIDLSNGNDTAFGGAGNDSIDASNGNDTIDGGSGDDTLIGNNNNDDITGGTGTDLMFGGNGNDTLRLGGSDITWDDPSIFAANKTLARSEDGQFLGIGITGTLRYDDSIDGGLGEDTLIGTADDDTLFFETNAFVDGGVTGAVSLIEEIERFDLGAGNDTLDLTSETLSYSENVEAYGGTGDDQVWGGDGNDMLFGGDGGDFLVGGAGTDTLSGNNADGSGDGDSDLFGVGDIAGAGTDRVTDFEFGTDMLIFVGFNVTTLADPNLSISFNAGTNESLITVSDDFTVSLVLEGVDATGLSADDFIFIA
ncbi:MAG: calcium-binding protein [Pseudomonadota bacterium]